MLTKICPFCKQEINRYDGNHIYKCKFKPKNISKEDVRLKFIEYNIGKDNIINIINDYNNLYSLPMLKNKYNLDFKSICFLLKYYNIEIRSISKSSKLISQEKCKQTCLKKYGVENVSQANEIKKKKQETFLLHYGVDNVWKLSDYNKKCAELHPESHLEHMEKLQKGRDKYFRTATYEQLLERNKKMIESQIKNDIFNSKLELRICNIFEDLNISYTRQFHINGYNHPYDFHLCNSKILIEINGTYWHADPKIYNENYSVRGTLAKNIWEKDKKHIEKAHNNNYIVITIWEDEIRKRNDEELKQYILNKLSEI